MFWFLLCFLVLFFAFTILIMISSFILSGRISQQEELRKLVNRKGE